MNSSLFSLLLIASLAWHTNTKAEKADSDKPINIEAEQFDYDRAKQIKTISGNVSLTRGTLIMKAGKVVIKEPEPNRQLATLLAAPGSLATFRQKSDSGNDVWIEGQAERIEYDSKTELVKLFSRAKLKRLEGSRTIEELEGSYVSYDSTTEFFKVSNTTSEQSKAGAGQVKIVIQPRTETKSK